MRVALVTDSSLFVFLSEPSRQDGAPMANCVPRFRGSVATPLSWEMNPLDRKLCVLAFRRVCPWNGLIVRFLAGISQAVWSLSADT